ncbi:MAG: hypothetical protein ABI624_16110 [Casimicrobiaceae bacterium]
MNGDRKTGSSDAAGGIGGDWLDRLLAEDGEAHRHAYVADDGFTARVLLALPALHAPFALPAWRKPVVLALWGVAAAGMAMAMPSAMLDVAREAYRLLAAQPVSLSGIAGAVVAMIALTSAAAAYSLRAND